MNSKSTFHRSDRNTSLCDIDQYRKRPTCMSHCTSACHAIPSFIRFQNSLHLFSSLRKTSRTLAISGDLPEPYVRTVWLWHGKTHQHMLNIYPTHPPTSICPQHSLDLLTVELNCAQRAKLEIVVTETVWNVQACWILTKLESTRKHLTGFCFEKKKQSHWADQLALHKENVDIWITTSYDGLCLRHCVPTKFHGGHRKRNLAIDKTFHHSALCGYTFTCAQFCKSLVQVQVSLRSLTFNSPSVCFKVCFLNSSGQWSCQLG